MAIYIVEQQVQMIKIYYENECSSHWPFPDFKLANFTLGLDPTPVQDSTDPKPKGY